MSRSHAATTWVSFRFSNSFVLPGPCMPQPTTPTTMRSEGLLRAPRPNALAGMIAGATTANAVAARKRRRLRPELSIEFFMEVMTPERAAGFENKMKGGNDS